MNEPNAPDAVVASPDNGTLPGSTDLQDDPVSRRILLCEVLVEEYESLEVDQFEIQELAKIRTEIDDWRKKKKPEEEKEFNGDMTLRVYRLMAKAQQNRAHSTVKQKAEDYERDYRGKDKNIEATDLRKIVDRAVVADTYGHLEDLRSQYLEDHADVEDETEREQLVREAIFEQIRKEALRKEHDPAKGTGSGKVKDAAGMTTEMVEKVVAQTQRSALCLSGGGIRSATFNLGVLQGLARHHLLEEFDYLSTVSGGGFIGGWLSAWICRAGLGNVMDELRKPPQSPLVPDPKPIEHLRIYSNYLSPQPGLLSADTWTLVATFLRNLVLNWLVFVPVLAILLMFPRMWTAILLRSIVYEPYAWFFYFTTGVILAVWAFTYIALHLPSARPYSANPCGEKHKPGQGPFIRRFLVWMTISAACFAISFWIRPLNRKQYVLVSEGIIVIPWIVAVIKVSRQKIKRLGSRFSSVIVATALIGVAQFIAGYVLNYAMEWFPMRADNPGPGKTFAYAIFAVPVILIVMSIGATLMAGFTSHFTKDDDQEWWARAGAWLAIVIVAWCTLNLVVLYGPWLVLKLDSTYHHIKDSGISKLRWRELANLAGMAAGVVSGVITLVGGFSAKTPANSKEAEKAGFGGLLLSLSTILVAPIFLAFVFILISLGTNWLLTSRVGQVLSSLMDTVGNWALGVIGQLTGNNFAFKFLSDVLPSPADHFALLSATSLRYLIVALVLMAILTFVLGRLINTNTFSLQYMWRNRIIRAYLGASRKERCAEPFTGFDRYDNLYMSELRTQPEHLGYQGPKQPRPANDKLTGTRSGKLMHVLNLALNLAGGEKLQWQDRRAESFTVSPLHAGSYWLGYRRSFRYGGEEGITLGAAIAISGAFVSPNMGFMMSSPVVRFLMTLFNVRFGWWLGNPGPAGDKTNAVERIVNTLLKSFGAAAGPPFRLDSPNLSVLPIVSEAFGNTDDQSPYVYLSDGGHFENLGLYEMVLRRCRFIVVSDASTDPDYSFQSLAMSVRQIRVDLGVPIDMPELSIDHPSQTMKGKYCAIGTIRYSCVDRDRDNPTMKDEDFDGVLIYLKPSMIGEEPRDVINYWQGSDGFPQENIVDQWFTEAQFESYRALGSHMIDAICGSDNNQINFAAFARKVREHNQLDFRSVREEISYELLAEQSKVTLEQGEFRSFKRRARKFVEKLLR